MPGRDRESIERELTVRYRNLDALSERQAKFGLSAPLELINQIHDEKEAITQLEELLQSVAAAAGVQTVAATSGGDSAAPVVSRPPEGTSLQTLEERDWDSLLRRIKEGNCTPFLGPDLTQGLVPADQDIAREWAREHQYPLEDTLNLPRVAQYLAVKRDPIFPCEDIARRLQSLPGPPNFRDPDEAHIFLAGLPLPIYITTNFDDFMTQALAYRLRQPYRELCRWNNYLRDVPSVFDPGSTMDISPANPVVYHLFGHAGVPESLVLTEDDYLDFLVNISRQRELIPRRIEKALVSTSLLFIGYPLNDWRFRVLFRGLVASLERSLRRTRLAVQLAPAGPGGLSADQARWYLEDYFARDDVRIYWGTTPDFIGELKQRWEEFISRG